MVLNSSALQHRGRAKSAQAGVYLAQRLFSLYSEG